MFRFFFCFTFVCRSQFHFKEIEWYYTSPFAAMITYFFVVTWLAFILQFLLLLLFFLATYVFWHFHWRPVNSVSLSCDKMRKKKTADRVEKKNNCLGVCDSNLLVWNDESGRNQPAFDDIWSCFPFPWIWIETTLGGRVRANRIPIRISNISRMDMLLVWKWNYKLQIFFFYGICITVCSELSNSRSSFHHLSGTVYVFEIHLFSMTNCVFTSYFYLFYLNFHGISLSFTVFKKNISVIRHRMCCRAYGFVA